MRSETRAPFVCGPLRVDVDEHAVTRDGRRLSVPPKAFQLLVLLLERRGGLVTKDELLTALWPDVVVQENNLTQQVSLLRRTIGDGVTIETVPRIGYRLTTPVETCTAALHEDHSAVRPSSPLFIRNRRRWLAAAAAALALICGSVWISMRTAGATETPRPTRTLAVLPLRSLADDPSLDHLGTGIADAVTYHLAVHPSLSLRPTATVLPYAKRNESVATVARELKVDTIVAGTIQRHGERIRVRIQLIDATRNLATFTAQFDEAAVDLFGIEDLVAGAVARALALDPPLSAPRSGRRASQVAGAYEAYLKGRHELAKRTPVSIVASIAQFEDATRLDPRYAAAWAALGEAYNLLPMHRVLAPLEAYPKAKHAAMTALKIDPESADAHAVLGTSAFYFEWDWRRAEAHLRRAIALDANCATARHVLSNLLVAAERFDEAYAVMDEARRRDPMSTTLASVSAYQLYLGRRFDASVARARQTLDRDRTFAQAHGILAYSLAKTGKTADAIAAIDHFATLLGSRSYATAQLATLYASVPERRREADAMRGRLLELLDEKKVSAFDLARFHAEMGEPDEALRRLSEARNERDPGIVWLRVDPAFDPLRPMPAFRRLVAETQEKRLVTAGATPPARDGA